MVVPSLIPALQLSVRAGVAATLALVLAQLLHLQHPLYAMISAVIVTDLDASQTPRLALPRFTGTLIGSGLGATVNTFLPPYLWTVGPGIMMAMLVSYLVSVPAAARIAGYVCGIVLLDHGDSPWTYGFFRMIETALGIGAAMLVSAIPKLLQHNATKADK